MSDADAPAALVAWYELMAAGWTPQTIASACAQKGVPLLEQAITHAIDAAFRFIPPNAMLDWMAAFEVWSSKGVPLVLDGSTRHAGARLAQGVKQHADRRPAGKGFLPRIPPVVDSLAHRLESLGLPGETPLRFAPGQKASLPLSRPSWGEVLAQYPEFVSWSAHWSAHRLSMDMAQAQERGGRTRL